MKQILKKHPSIWIAISLIGIGSVILIFFLISLDVDFNLAYKGNLGMPETGQVGDFIGGVIGTLFALAGTVLLVITLIIQIKSNEVRSFEGSFFELVKLHKENVNEMSYFKFQHGEITEFQNRKAFQVMFKEFEECYSDVLKFTRHIEESEFLIEKYRIELDQLISNNSIKTDPYTLSKINLAYSIFFYGISEEGERLLREKFKNKFNVKLLYQLFLFLKLKPKRTHVNKDKYASWMDLRSKPRDYFFTTIEGLYNARHQTELLTLNSHTITFSALNDFVRFYGGHQHRLSHYFRHLFQTYEFLDKTPVIEFNDKYEYGKILRSQLSTYEQTLLFCNAISDLGWRWEYTSEEKRKLITKYKLIKNVPGDWLKDIKPSDFFPEIEL